MIKKLRKKFVFISTLSVFIMLLLVFGALTTVNFISMDRKTDTLLNFIESSNGNLIRGEKNIAPPKNIKGFPHENIYDTRFFIAFLNEQNEIKSINLGNIFSVDYESAHDFATEILSQNKSSGYVESLKFKLAKINDSSAIIFVDATGEINLFYSFVANSLIISLVAMILTLIISYTLSGAAIKPIVNSYEKQKQFITNASHEIKTPLTVISANMDILEMSFGENKWIYNSKEQVSRLTSLVNSMTALTRFDEQISLEKSFFSITETANLASESFVSVAEKEEKSFQYKIEENLNFNGDEKAFGQLFYILLDNAVKYSEPLGEIIFTVEKRQHKIIIKVKNSVLKTEKGEHQEFFDRFYKGDFSREMKKKSFGIGLSIAKEIVSSHKGNIFAYSENTESFTIKIEL